MNQLCMNWILAHKDLSGWIEVRIGDPFFASFAKVRTSKMIFSLFAISIIRSIRIMRLTLQVMENGMKFFAVMISNTVAQV